MDLLNIACILITCVAANHLGLIPTIEKVTGYRLPIVNCPKCLTFWVTLVYGCDNISTYMTGAGLLEVLAISFLCAYLAIWLELGMGMIDYLYNKVYEKIYEPAEDNETATDPDEGDSAGSVSEL